MATGKNGKNNGGSDKLPEKRGRTHLVCVRTYDKIMHTLRLIDAWKTDTQGCVNRGERRATPVPSQRGRQVTIVSIGIQRR